MARSDRMRADVLVVERGLAPSRSRAQALIMAGEVLSGTRRVDKAGEQLQRDAPLRLASRPPYVSRGGEKLAHALEHFADLRVADRICLDIGASTGGFTDCLLQHGARRVYAVDVGYGQLHPRLRDDARVVVRERTNARHATAEDFPDSVEVVVVDASFISIRKLLDAITSILIGSGDLVALVKPQFEAGREAADAGRGVIADPEIRQRAIADATARIEAAGLEVTGSIDSPIRGPKGNLEHLVRARRR